MLRNGMENYQSRPKRLKKVKKENGF